MKITPMKNYFPLILAALLSIQPVRAQTLIEGGEVSGLWDIGGSPYRINGEINIPSGQLLTIEPGVRVHFLGHHRFFVYGTLMAAGTVNDSIYFTVENDTVEWCGVEFSNPAGSVPRSLLEYCVIEHSYAYSGLSWPYTSNYDVGGGIMAELGNLTLRNSVIRNNKALIGAGIKCGNNIVIENSSFTNNEALQKDVVFIDNGGKMSGCLIAGNRASRNMVRIQLETLFLNNTISGNYLDSSGVSIVILHGDPDVVNTIIYENNVQTIHVTGGSQPRFYNCNIEGGKNSIFAYDPDYRGEFGGIYEHNIDCPPAFLDSDHQNYALSANSPCIDGGSYLDWNPSLLTDITGAPRIANNTEQQVDMGAYEFQGDPLNRAPYIQDTTKIYKLKGLTRKIRIPYYDSDPLDSHVFDISTDHDSVTAILSAADNSNIDIEIESNPGWTGVCTLLVSITDNSGAANNSCSAQIPIHVGKQFRGKIEFDQIFRDTVEIVGDVFVWAYGSLKVEAGTFVRFQDHYKMAVYGELLAQGIEEKRIRFDIVDSIAAMQDEYGNTCGWGGIEMYYLNPPEPMAFSYCDFYNTGFNRDFNVELGTIYLSNCSNILFDQCRFSSNQNVYNGERNAGIKMDDCFGIQIRNCEFSDCFARGTYKGTYIWGYNSDFTIDSCLIRNTPIQGTSAIETNGGSATIRNSEFYDSQILMMSIGTRDTDISIIENNYFHDNYGGSIRSSGYCIIRNNTFLRTISPGGVMGIGGNADVIGNFIAYNDNQAFNVGNFMGIAMNIEGDARVVNNTIVKNFNRANGGAIHVSYASPYIANNILWDNDKEGIHWYNGAGVVTPPTIENNVVKGGYVDYDYNFGWDPYFRLNDSLDYQLTDSSLCINLALTDNAVLGQMLTLDIAGNPRYDTVFRLLDIGAYEFQGPFAPADTLSGIAYDQDQIDLDLYPNPVTEELQVVSTREILEYAIINLQGTVIRQGRFTGRIPVKDLPGGQYILSVKSPAGIAMKVFLKL